ncbi:unnamed protein product [Cylicocyclus nassatus]|uniref:Uncharacterized protein n=1 Tax=Cylicocyclus nassatus TaxID=53992 RepID=A0AA36HCH2_CYLNA|nr:unnamed protein product [Cylicocyclus nassatus]
MITVSYIILKTLIISLLCLRILLQCSRMKKKKKTASEPTSYIEEDTKLEEKYLRPAWDKDFPNILPPPVHVAEKENKEVDVELDMAVGAPNIDTFKSSAIESDYHHRDADARPSEILDPFFIDDVTQDATEEKEKKKKKSKEGVGKSKRSEPLRSARSARLMRKKEEMRVGGLRSTPSEPSCTPLHGSIPASARETEVKSSSKLSGKKMSKETQRSASILSKSLDKDSSRKK